MLKLYSFLHCCPTAVPPASQKRECDWLVLVALNCAMSVSLDMRSWEKLRDDIVVDSWDKHKTFT